MGVAPLDDVVVGDHEPVAADGTGGTVAGLQSQVPAKQRLRPLAGFPVMRILPPTPLTVSPGVAMMRLTR